MIDAYNEYQKNYQGESDRSVVILAASFLEKSLEDYLLRKLVEGPSSARLFEGYS